jgi:hypothetical protein
VRFQLHTIPLPREYVWKLDLDRVKEMVSIVSPQVRMYAEICSKFYQLLLQAALHFDAAGHSRTAPPSATMLRQSFV